MEDKEESIYSSDTIEQDIPAKKQRPVFLSILCIIVFVYSGFFILLFISGVIFNNRIVETSNEFIPVIIVEKNRILLLLISGIVLYIFSFLGASYIWKLNRKGFFIYLVSTILIIIGSWFIGLKDILSTIILFLLILLFGLYYRKFG
ncbi:MAG: hypothetical protein K8R68_08655 [Bacteroidales bacterium]|nr:hypothetical protein [Bacteroidales bacterium]